MDGQMRFRVRVLGGGTCFGTLATKGGFVLFDMIWGDAAMSEWIWSIVMN